MANTFQTQLPPEYSDLVDEIREERSKRLEDTSNVGIVKDALKMLHKNLTKGKK